MNHGMRGRKFGRRKEHRAAMLMNLAKSLITHGRIFTTLPKAKDLRPVVEKLVTLGKRGDLNARRQAIAFLRGNNDAVKKLFSDVAEKNKSRNGGYLRILKSGYRQGDNAPMAMIEFVDQ